MEVLETELGGNLLDARRRCEPRLALDERGGVAKYRQSCLCVVEVWNSGPDSPVLQLLQRFRREIDGMCKFVRAVEAVQDLAFAHHWYFYRVDGKQQPITVCDGQDRGDDVHEECCPRPRRVTASSVGMPGPRR